MNKNNKLSPYFITGFSTRGSSLKRGFSTIGGNSNTKPEVIYDNADTQKELIMKDNRGKAGIYR